MTLQCGAAGDSAAAVARQTWLQSGKGILYFFRLIATRDGLIESALLIIAAFLLQYIYPYSSIQVVLLMC